MERDGLIRTKMIGISFTNVTKEMSFSYSEILHLYNQLHYNKISKLNIVYVFYSSELIPDFKKQEINGKLISPGYKLMNYYNSYSFSIIFLNDFFNEYYSSLILDETKTKLLNNTLFIFEHSWLMFCFLSRCFRFPIGGGSNNKNSRLSELEFTFSHLLSSFGFEREDIKKSFLEKKSEIQTKGILLDTLGRIKPNSFLKEKEYEDLELLKIITILICYPQDLEYIPLWLLNQIINTVNKKNFTLENLTSNYPNEDTTKYFEILGLSKKKEYTLLSCGLTNFKLQKEEELTKKK